MKFFGQIINYSIKNNKLSLKPLPKIGILYTTRDNFKVLQYLGKANFIFLCQSRGNSYFRFVNDNTHSAVIYFFDLVVKDTFIIFKLYAYTCLSQHRDEKI